MKKKTRTISPEAVQKRFSKKLSAVMGNRPFVVTYLDGDYVVTQHQGSDIQVVGLSRYTEEFAHTLVSLSPDTKDRQNIISAIKQIDATHPYEHH